MVVGEQSELNSRRITSEDKLEFASEVHKEKLTEDDDMQESTQDDTQHRKYEKRIWIQDPTGIATRTGMKTGSIQMEKESGQSGLALIAEVYPLSFNEVLNSSDAIRGSYE